MRAHCVRCGRPAARSERTVDGKRYEIYTCPTAGHGEVSRGEIDMPEDPADAPAAAELGAEDDGDEAEKGQPLPEATAPQYPVAQAGFQGMTSGNWITEPVSVHPDFAEDLQKENNGAIADILKSAGPLTLSSLPSAADLDNHAAEQQAAAATEKQAE